MKHVTIKEEGGSRLRKYVNSMKVMNGCYQSLIPTCSIRRTYSYSTIKIESEKRRGPCAARGSIILKDK